MRPAKFEYFAPDSLAEAARLLTESDGTGRILAGGQSLMPAMNLRLARPSRVIDLRKVPALDGIVIETDRVRIGAKVTHAALIVSAPLQTLIPLIAMAGRHIAHSTVREHGTMGGSLALADPASEWPTVLTLLGGRVRALSVRGERWIDARSFFVSLYTTELAADEILVEIEIPLPRPGTRFAFKEFARQRGAFAIAMAAVALSPSPAGRGGRFEAVIGGCGAHPIRVDFASVETTERLQERIDEAFTRAAVAPTSDIHASAEDRRRIASSLLGAGIADLLRSTREGGV